MRFRKLDFVKPKLLHADSIKALSMSIFMIYGLIKVILNQIRIMTIGGHNWGIGEWLINYNGGFIRRGLVGELVLNLASSGHAALLIVTIGTILVYLFIWIYMFSFLIKNKFSGISFLIVASPVGALFVAWDMNVFVRKEYLGFLILIISSLFLKFNFQNYLFIIFIFMIVFFTLSIFASEINYFILPSFIYIMKQLNISRRQQMYLFTFLLLSTTTSVILIILFHGSAQSSNSICDLLIQSGLSSNLNCLGAIATIDMPLNEAIVNLIGMYPDYLFYLPLFIFAITPFFIIDWFSENIMWILFFFLFTFPLYVIAWDYGRWISLFFMQTVICFIATGNVSSKFRRINPIMIVFYVLFWGVWHGGSPVENGFIGGVVSIIKDLSIYS